MHGIKQGVQRGYYDQIVNGEQINVQLQGHGGLANDVLDKLIS